MKSIRPFLILAAILSCAGCGSPSQPAAPKPNLEKGEELLRTAESRDIHKRRLAAAELCIILLKKNGVWKKDDLNWKVPTEEGIRQEVSHVRKSDQTEDLAIANMCAHCMGMLQHGGWHSEPIDKSPALEKGMIDVARNTRDPVVRTILLVGLASSESVAARDEVILGTRDPHFGVRKAACYLVECCARNYFGPSGNIHIGSSQSDVAAASRKIRAIYRWDKTLGVGWGPMRDGLQTRLAVEPLAGHVGRAISGSLVVRNVSDEPLSVPNKVHPMQYFRVLHNKKKYVDRKTEVIPPALSKMTIIPGNQLRVWAFRLDELFSLSTPGDYEVWLPETDGALPPHSNRVQLRSDWANYHRALRNGETVLIGRIEYQKDWCRVGDRMSCYTIKLKNGTQYPLVFDPVIPTRVTPGEYDVTGHFLGISDKRYEKAFSVRLWSLVK